MRTSRRLIKNCHKVDLRAIVHVDLPFYPPKFTLCYFFLKLFRNIGNYPLPIPSKKKINIKLKLIRIFSSIIFNAFTLFISFRNNRCKSSFEKKKKISCVRMILDSRILFVISGNKNVEWLR